MPARSISDAWLTPASGRRGQGSARRPNLKRAETLELALPLPGIDAGASTALEKPLRCMCTSWSISTSPVATYVASKLASGSAAAEPGCRRGHR